MKSLQDTAGELNPKYTMSVIRAALRTPKGSRCVWVIVEDSDDIVVYERFLNENTTKILTSESKDGHKGCAYEEAIVSDIKSTESNAFIFGIRDADYTRYETNGHRFPADVFVTDCRDIEMMMLSAPSVQSSLMAWDKNLLANLNKGEHVVRKFGYMRICNHLRNLGCNFKKKVKISLAWDESSHSIRPDWERLVVDKFIDNCNVSFTETELNDIVAALNLSTDSIYNVCQGHDVLNLLQYMMVKTNVYNDKTIRNKMVDAYSEKDFSSSALYKSIEMWAVANNKIVLN